MIDHPQITITATLLMKLLANNVCFINCNESHLPYGMMLPLEAHTLQQQRFRSQIEASIPLRKQLWQAAITAKIYNQHQVLSNRGIDDTRLLRWSKQVKSADKDNLEAVAAKLYWSLLLKERFPDFVRERFGIAPNNYFNFGYIILRGITARSLAGSGLLPTLGIFHRNQYNAYALADDIMEPYRPVIDAYIMSILDTIEPDDVDLILTKETKALLLKIPTLDVLINGSVSPLMVGLQRTTASLARSFESGKVLIRFPEINSIPP